MIISTIILICLFYLYFPQGLAILSVSPALLLNGALSWEQEPVGMVDTTDASGVSSVGRSRPQRSAAASYR